MSSDPFRIPLPLALRWPVETALGLTALRRLYHAAGGDSVEPFERRVLRALNIGVDVTPSDLASLPATGPIVVVANHPHGALDGLILLELVRRVRPDVRMLANRLLARIPELRDSSFFVDPFEGAEAAARSLAGLRAAHLWLRRGGALVVFPAGEVGHTWSDGSLRDGEWKTTFERLACASRAAVVTATIAGRNSGWFYLAGRIHERARTALLGRELLNKRGQTIAVSIGRQRPPSEGQQRSRSSGQWNAIADEVARLDRKACLVDAGSLQVFCAPAEAIPATLHEIGRLRELTFRAVGEGTGRTIDLDRFDQSYLHLFAWDRRRNQVVGAYRLGCTDRICSRGGVDGLYTRTLFRYDERLLARLGGPALELGRSFVRAEYQKNSNALLQLWRGIGTFVARHPQYRFLFGPVSISARYADTSHALLVEFLRQNHVDRDLADLVDAVAPPKLALPAGTAVPGSIAEMNRLVSGLECDGKSMPVLLRQYLKLNARLLGVNVDRNFGDALDALMIVDLLNVDRAVLQRYLGKAGAATLLAAHRRAA